MLDVIGICLSYQISIFERIRINDLEKISVRYKTNNLPKILLNPQKISTRFKNSNFNNRAYEKIHIFRKIFFKNTQNIWKPLLNGLIINKRFTSPLKKGKKWIITRKILSSEVDETEF